MSKKLIKLTSLALAVVLCLSGFTACGSKEAPATGAARHLTFDGYAGVDLVQPRASWKDPNGSGDLTFAWDYTQADGTTPNNNEMVFAIYNGSNFISNETADKHYTYVSVNKHSDPDKDSHHAEFETIEKYTVSDAELEDNTVFAVTPLNDSNNYELTSYQNAFEVKLKMPSTFTQTTSGDPSFLRDYMYMYGTSTFANGSASIGFYHIPATFRFVINNMTSEPIDVSSVKVEANNISAQSVTLWANTTSKALVPDFTGTDNSITTNLNVGDNSYATLSALTDDGTDDTFIAYALALPTENAVSTLTFTLTVGGETYEAKVVTNKTLQSGYSYTVVLDYYGYLSVSSISEGTWDSGWSTETELN